jgi:hypothetical protein
MSSFSRFVDRTDANCQNYSIKKWQRNVKQFKNYSMDRFYRNKSNLSLSQIREIFKLDARYLGIVSAQGVIDAKGILDDVRTTGPQVFGSFLDTFLNRTKDK